MIKAILKQLPIVSQLPNLKKFNDYDSSDENKKRDRNFAVASRFLFLVSFVLMKISYQQRSISAVVSAWPA